MAIVVVGGNAKDVGKTALVCGIISALPEFAWTAVKITGHDYEPVVPAANESAASCKSVREETSAGSETDTARFLAAGARRALLITRVGADLPMEEIRRALGSDRNILFESNRIVDAVRPDVCVALVGRATAEVKASFSRLLSVADAVVTNTGVDESLEVDLGVPRFRLQSPDRVSPEMASWLRERLNAASQPISR